jgi:hypothetical protein
MLHTDTMLRSVLKAENPHESDSFVMNAHATRKSPTARARLPACACPRPPTPARGLPAPARTGSTCVKAILWTACCCQKLEYLMMVKL